MRKLRLNVAYTRLNLHEIGLRDGPLCPESETIDTSQHIICRCHLYGGERGGLQTYVTTPTSTILTVADVVCPWINHKAAQWATKALLKFLWETGLHNQLWHVVKAVHSTFGKPSSPLNMCVIYLSWCDSECDVMACVRMCVRASIRVSPRVSCVINVSVLLVPISFPLTNELVARKVRHASSFFFSALISLQVRYNS